MPPNTDEAKKTDLGRLPTEPVNEKRFGLWVEKACRVELIEF